MKCPGQDTQYWNPDAIFETQCTECGHPMEFFKDDATRRCPSCKKKMVNPKMDFGCAAYCKFAEACLGTLPEEFLALREDLFKDRVAVEMKRYFKTDFKRIGHASKVARYAETMGKKEKADLAVVLCAAYLYDIGIKHAMEKYGEKEYQASAAKYLELEGPPVARQILENMGAPPPLVEAVCFIVGRHQRQDTCDCLELKVVRDADMLVHMLACDKRQGGDATEVSEKIDRLFMTDSGRVLAKELLIQ